MLKKIDYTTIQQQIDLLKEKELIFENEENAKLVLERYGYYNIINSYKEPYQIFIDGKRKYISCTTFEQIYSIFTLDHNLRNSIMASMLELEECLRSATAEVIASSFGTDHNIYLNFRNFRDRHSANPKFSLNGILGTLRNNAASDKDPIKYYREKYGIVPPWILLKGTYFSTLINLIKCLKNEQKQYLIKLLLHIPTDVDVSNELISLFQTTLFICLDYRNTAAHGGRIYNFHSRYINDLKISDKIISIFPKLNEAKSASGMSLLLLLLNIFKNKQPNAIIKTSLNKQLNRHLSKYPKDIDVLSQSIQISIKSEPYVWINEKTHTFHNNEYCSGMLHAQKVRYATISKSIYFPCKRCFKSK